MRTERLFLRPGWIEDAPAIASAIATPEIVRNLARAPWPYGLAEAQAFASMEQDPRAPHFLLHLPQEGVIGSAGFGQHGDDIEIGYWIGQKWWGRGYATEAALALVAIARMLGHRRLVAGHFIDNPASGAVLRKAGFAATGKTVMRHSMARGEDVPACEYARDIAGQAVPFELPRAA